MRPMRTRWLLAPLVSFCACSSAPFVARGDGSVDGATGANADLAGGDRAGVDLASHPITFSPVASGTTGVLRGLWGSGPNELFVVGNMENILHSKNGGASFELQHSGQSQLDAVWGSSASDVYAVGWGAPTLLHSANGGTSWESEPSGTSGPPLQGLWGSGASDILACDGIGEVLRFDGASWTHQAVGASALSALWGSGTDRFAVGSVGGIYHSADSGKSWSAQVSGSTLLLTAIWGSSASELYVAGADGLGQSSGAILRSHDGGKSWQSTATNAPIWSLWGSGAGDVWVTGGGGTILHSSDGGTSWQPVTSGVTADLFVVWGTGPGDLWIAGDQGVLLHGS